jgi:hypothetical protein
MIDKVLQTFLEKQQRAGAELAANSDILTLTPQPSPFDVPVQYLAEYGSRGVLCEPDGRIHVAETSFAVGITFGPEHLRKVDPFRLLTMVSPNNVFHTNTRGFVVCCGRAQPGVELVDLLYFAYELIGFHNFSIVDALNHEAATWARHHQHLFPVETRPLRRPRAKRLAKHMGGHT